MNRLDNGTTSHTGHDAGTIRHLVMVCGNKYGFQALWAAVIEQLGRVAQIHLYLLDYPESYDVTATLETLKRQGSLASATMVPDNRRAWRHHQALGSLSRSLRNAPMDLLIVDSDFMPLCQYLIRTARARGVPVIGLQKEVPKRLLISFGAATQTASRDRQSLSGRIGSRLGRLYIRAERAVMLRSALRTLRVRLWRPVNYMLHHYALPWLHARCIFPLRAVDRATLFCSDRVDAVIVYQAAVKQAVEHFFPGVPVYLARHPLAGLCRCQGRSDAAKLLVVLTGPWRNYIGLKYPVEQLEEQWCKLIAKVAMLRGLSEVHIRPHPREDGPYAHHLADRLAVLGLRAAVTDHQQQALRDVVCGYAGVLGPPSGALAEAAVCCQQAFVVGVQGLQGRRPEPAVSDFFPEITAVSGPSALGPEHLTRRHSSAGSESTITDLLKAWIR